MSLAELVVAEPVVDEPLVLLLDDDEVSEADEPPWWP
jgi:hypothetical protein